MRLTITHRVVSRKRLQDAVRVGAQRYGHRARDSEAGGSIPSVAVIRNNLGQVAHAIEQLLVLRTRHALTNCE